MTAHRSPDPQQLRVAPWITRTIAAGAVFGILVPPVVALASETAPTVRAEAIPTPPTLTEPSRYVARTLPPLRIPTSAPTTEQPSAPEPYVAPQPAPTTFAGVTATATVTSQPAPTTTSSTPTVTTVPTTTQPTQPTPSPTATTPTTTSGSAPATTTVPEITVPTVTTEIAPTEIAPTTEESP